MVGCGALGTVASELLVRAGVGNVRIIDRDVVELTNLQRQLLFTERDAAEQRPKAIAAASRLREVNSSVEINGVIADLSGSKAVTLLRGSTVVVDATDNYVTRFTINDACLELGLPWVYGGAVGSRGMTATFMPGGACFRCLFSGLPALGAGDSCELEGVLASATTTVAAIEVSEALKAIIAPEAVRSDVLDFDLWTGKFYTMALSRDDNCPACQTHDRAFLLRENPKDAIAICGRDSVLVRGGVDSLDIAALAGVLIAKGLEVKQSKFTLGVRLEGRDVVLFTDGRGLIGGTNDAREAQRIYNAIIGI